jgi:hypothetical protein
VGLRLHRGFDGFRWLVAGGWGVSAGHTPGPFECISGNEIWSTKSLTNTPIAKVFKRLQPGETEANTRLIACAPELLEVLKELHESASYWSEYDVPIGIVDRIRSAITKATGETP